MLIALLSIIIDVFNYKDKLKSDADNKILVAKLNASEEIQKSQFFELKSLRSETALLQDIGKTQLKAILYAEELNQKIGKVLFRIKLKNEILFQDICPFGLLFQVNTMSNKKLKYRSFVENARVMENGGRKLMLQSYSIFNVQDDGKCVGGHIRGSSNSTGVENIVIELDYPLDAGLLRDFHDEKLHVWVSENILNQTSFIELVANGWAILHRDMSKSDWSRV